MRAALTLEQCWHTVPGGVAAYGIGLAGALAARGDVDVVGVAARHLGPPAPAWAPPVPVRHLRLGRPALYTAWHLARRPRLEAATGPIDVAHATVTMVPGSRAPLVVTMHDLTAVVRPDFLPSRAAHYARRGIAQARRHAAAVVCVSEHSRAACLEAGFAADRLFVTWPGVDARRASAEDVAKAKAGHGLDRPYVLWTGTVEPRKNLPGLLAAWRGLRADGSAGDRELVLVGPAGWGVDLDGLLGPDRAGVRVLGFVPVAERRGLYAAADALCYPSFLEGFGLPVAEAMAQGTPVVTSSGTATAEVGGDAAVLVDPGDVDDIARGIATVLAETGAEKDARRRRSLAQAAHFTWEACAERTVEAYRAVLA
jgi:glycosyltransferase involved in cell wall biosynthesis